MGDKTFIAHVDGFYQSDTVNALSQSPAFNVDLDSFQIWGTAFTLAADKWNASLWVKEHLQRGRRDRHIHRALHGHGAGDRVLRQRCERPDLAAADDWPFLQLQLLNSKGTLPDFRQDFGKSQSVSMNSRNDMTSQPAWTCWSTSVVLTSLIQRRQLAEARHDLRRLPDAPSGSARRAGCCSRASASRGGDYRGMLESARHAPHARSREHGRALHRDRGAHARGRHRGRPRLANRRRERRGRRPAAPGAASPEFHSHLNQHEQAATCAIRVASLKPYDAQAAYTKASTLIAIGRMDEAEIAARRGDRAHARRRRRLVQPRDDSPANCLRATTSRRCAPRSAGRSPGAAPVALHYALAKEFEDLGEYAESYAALRRRARRGARCCPTRWRPTSRRIASIIRSFDRELV